MPPPPTSSPSAIVVGGGPAGLMAAEVLATAGFSVAVHEHRRSVGRKFLLAGRGGLNLTHSEDFDAFVGRYRDRAPQLRQALEAFTPDDLRRWSAGLGEETFAGSSGRVFPSSFRATPLLRAWLLRLTGLGVTFHTRSRWTGFDAGAEGELALAFDTGSERTVAVADVTVMALGGASWPRVGSDGGWVEAFRSAGVDVVPLTAANGGLSVAWSPPMGERFAGEPIKNVIVSAGGSVARGDCVVTNGGLEGGPIYAIGPDVRHALGRGDEAVVSFDLQPDLTSDRLEARLERRRPRDSASTWLRRAGLAPVAVALLREATGNTLPTDPEAMAALVKDTPIRVAGTMPIDRAISTAGGVAFDALDDNWMLRDLPGVFVAGEMLDWEAPTGGYLLQACFSTGVAAATGAISWLERP